MFVYQQTGSGIWTYSIAIVTSVLKAAATILPGYTDRGGKKTHGRGNRRTPRGKNFVGFLESRELELAPEPKPAGWYLRLTVGDEPGIIARVAEVLAREGMNIDSANGPHLPRSRKCGASSACSPVVTLVFSHR